jgi:hypothetical protein
MDCTACEWSFDVSAKTVKNASVKTNLTLLVFEIKISDWFRGSINISEFSFFKSF